MLPRRALMAGAAALGVGCGPLRSILSPPQVPKKTQLTWVSLGFSGLYEPAVRVQDPLAKLKRAVAALEEDTDNPNGPARGNYSVTPYLLEFRQLDSTSWSNLVTRLSELKVDLLSLHAPLVRALAELAEKEQRVLLPLDRFVGADGPLLSQEFYPYLLNPFRFNGSLYALPVDALPLMLYYDARYFAAAGAPPVDGNWDWDSLVQSAAQLTRRDEDGVTRRWGLEAHRYGLWWALWQNNAVVHDPESGECRLREPAAIEALQFYRDLLHDHRVSPPVAGKDVDKLYNVSSDSWPAMIYSPQQDMWSGDYRWAALPAGKTHSVPVYTDMSIAITDWTESTEAAYTALKGLVGIMQQYVSVPAKIEAVARLGEFRRNLRPPEVAAVQDSMQHGRVLPQGVPTNDGMPALMQALIQGEAAFQLTREAAPRMEMVVDALVRGDDVTTIASQVCA